MRLLGFEITTAREAEALKVKAQAYESIGHGSGGWFPIVQEPWGGAFQQGVSIDASRDVLAFSGVFAIVTAIAQDVAKLSPAIMEKNSDGILQQVEQSPFLTFLRRPNHYQTWQKFIEQWIVSKLLYGNAYVVKEREPVRRMVSAAYVLNPRQVKPLITDAGDVYYEIEPDGLSRVSERVIVPAREIFHDAMVCLFHRLIGVSPLYAAAMSATQGRRIQKNSTRFFENMSRPSGMITSPQKIDDELANRIKREFEQNYGGGNIGKTMIGGLGTEYKAMAMPAETSQLIEQLGWTVEDVARPFHFPMYKLGGAVPSGSSIDALNQAYYSDCLQGLIKSLQDALDYGLDLPIGRCVELDLDDLIRMDRVAKITMLKESVGGGIHSPNEARAKLNLPPVEGGDMPYLQEQQFSLEALAKRDALADPWQSKNGTKPAAPATPPAANDEEAEDETEEQVAASLTDLIIRELEADLAQA